MGHISGAGESEHHRVKATLKRASRLDAAQPRRSGALGLVEEALLDQPRALLG